MRFYTTQHRYYCGIDLHARTMYVCILNQAGEVLVHRNLRASEGAVLEVLAPYRDDLVVGVECIFTWYWIADLCEREKIAFVLGHALYMKAIHGAKTKNDKIDSQKIAAMLRGGMMPQAYVYPPIIRVEPDSRSHDNLEHRFRDAILGPHTRQPHALIGHPLLLRPQIDAAIGLGGLCPLPEPGANWQPMSQTVNRTVRGN